MTVTLHDAVPSQAPGLGRLTELYQHDLSAYERTARSGTVRLGSRSLDLY